MKTVHVKVSGKVQGVWFRASTKQEAEKIEINGKTLDIPAMMPKLSETPGGTEWPGGEVASHNEHVFKDILGLSDDDIAQLAKDSVI